MRDGDEVRVAPTVAVDVSQFKERDWVHVECREVDEPVPAGVFLGGGCIIAKMYVPDVYYKAQYKMDVVILVDHSLERIYVIRLEDIKLLERYHPDVEDD